MLDYTIMIKFNICLSYAQFNIKIQLSKQTIKFLCVEHAICTSNTYFTIVEKNKLFYKK